MAMDTNAWKIAVLGSVRKISDASYQEKSWLDSSTNISSPEEIYCELFDDFIFDDFLDGPDIPITNEQRLLGKNLRDALNKYADSFDCMTAPQKVLNDLEWKRIQNLADSFLNSF